MVVDGSDLVRAYGRRCGMHAGRDEELLATMVCDLAHWAAREDAMICTLGLPASADLIHEGDMGPAAPGHWVGTWRPVEGPLDNPARAARIDDVVAEVTRRAGDDATAPLVDALAMLRRFAQGAEIAFDPVASAGLARYSQQMCGAGEIDVTQLAAREPVGYEDLMQTPELAREEWHALNRAIHELRARRAESGVLDLARDVQADRARIAEMFPHDHPGFGRGCHPIELDDDGQIADAPPGAA